MWKINAHLKITWNTLFIAGFSLYCLFDPLICSAKEAIVNVEILFLATKLLDLKKEKNKLFFQ